MAIKIIEKREVGGWLGFTAYVGAFIYFMQGAFGLTGFLLALLKAAVWPGYVVYYALKMLGA